ncbi:hypothetical protein AAG906_019432 [Vitis piasezkii]
MEVYINDIVVKSKTRAKHVQHLEEALCLMRTYKMKLNPAKCDFGVSVGKLGFMVTQRGIEVKPDQVKVIFRTPTPNNKKELQLFTSRHVALGHFIACFINKLRLFFFTLRGTSMFCLILQSPIRELIKQAIYLSFFTSNNEAKYETVLVGLELALILAVAKLESRKCQKRKQAHKLCIKAAHFTLINDQLYKRSFEGPYLKCLSELEVKYVITELHEGVCGNHPSGQTLAHRTYTQGCHWPTMKWDVENYVKK